MFWYLFNLMTIEMFTCFRKTQGQNTAQNANNTVPSFFSKWFKSIYGLPYFMLKNSIFCPCWSVFSFKHGPCSVLNTESPYLFTGFPCLVLNTDQHRQNTDFFSIKYGSPYIDLNHLEKNSEPCFWRFA